MPQYVVKPGEHLFEIAEREGFRSADTLWQDGGNAHLRSKRANPGVLAPGDVLFIPVKQEKRVGCATDKVHRFVAKTDMLKLRLTLLDFDRRPIAGAVAVLSVEGQPHVLTSDGDGVIEQSVQRSARSAQLKVEAWGIDLPVSIGELDPVALEAGWRARLINLGYYRGELAEDDEGAARRWSWAVEEFQCDHGLAVNGQLDGATLSKIESVHGS